MGVGGGQSTTIMLEIALYCSGDQSLRVEYKIFLKSWHGVPSHLTPFMFPDERLTQPYNFKYILGSTIAGHLPTFHVVRIHFSTDNSGLLFNFCVPFGLFLTLVGQSTWPQFL